MKTLRIWDCLAVELAVKLYDHLDGSGDEYGRLYEYLPEAREVIEWIRKVGDTPDKNQLEEQLTKVLSDSLSHEYSLEAFSDVAEFVLGRLLALQRQYG